ncbi:hypothetical protein, conserved [Plasmodium gonderi]|uniref:Uncharacterized protein n=1 Tax=Plasmodium gonderi TaxID=77519 RepID=A0A1Y1JKN8_PLAGO|nr:hypothetical protein, conserved [Plasmodium gonderi]GAW82860.1 hypothetical protein, conserved [Plasmodium gonderi]
MAALARSVGKCLKIRKGNFPNLHFSSYRKSDIHYQYEEMLNIGNKNPEQVISLLNDVCRKKRCDVEMVKCITNHIYDFSDDFFCPQLVKILENYVKLKYSDETLLGIVCNRVEDLVSIRSCLRIKTLINVCKQLNLHHPIVKLRVLLELNSNINDYKNELVSILKNISYLHVDSITCSNIINRLIINYEYYDKDIFTIFEAFSRLDEPNERFIDLVDKKVKQIQNKSDNCCNLKNFIKFLSACKRLGLKENTYLHTQFEKKINNIKLLSPQNISYILLLMLSTKFRHQGLFDLLIMNMENYVNNKGENQVFKREELYLPQLHHQHHHEYLYHVGKRDRHKTREEQLFSFPIEEIKRDNMPSFYNAYILHFLPFHLVLLTLLNYEEKNTLKLLLNVCIIDYIFLYDTSNLIKLLYTCTLLMEEGKRSNKGTEEMDELEKTAHQIFRNLQHVYKNATINDMKILHTCFLYHKNSINKNPQLKKLHEDLTHNHCFSLLPSSYDNLNFENLKVIKCASSSYLKSKSDNSIFFYLSKNDFFATDLCKYETLLPSVKLRKTILTNKYDSTHDIKMLYRDVPLFY